MKRLLLFIFIFLFAFVKAQVSMPVINFGDEKYILKQYEKQALSKDFIAQNYTWSYIKVGDTLIITASNPAKTIRKLTFTGAGKTCDFDQIIYTSCDSCTQFAIKDMIETKFLGWKKTQENIYLSKWFWKTELMVVNRHQENATLTFRSPKLEKVQYKRIYETGINEPYIYDMGGAKDEEIFNKGYDAEKHKHYEEAIAYYTKAIELNPKDADAYTYRGIAKFNLDRYLDVIKDCTKAIELNPNDALAYYDRGDAKYFLERYTEAIIDYKKALKINPYDRLYKRGFKNAYKKAYE